MPRWNACSESRHHFSQFVKSVRQCVNWKEGGREGSKEFFPGISSRSSGHEEGGGGDIFRGSVLEAGLGRREGGMWGVWRPRSYSQNVGATGELLRVGLTGRALCKVFGYLMPLYCYLIGLLCPVL